MTEKRHAVVTGAAGFVGSALVGALLDRGFVVHAVVRPKGRSPSLRHPRLRVVPCELPDLGALAGLPAPGVVYHTAAVVDPGRLDDEALCQRVNTEAAAGLARWALEQGSQLVFTSSIAAMGFYDAPSGVTEASACRPVSAYGRSKLAAEQQIEALREQGLCAAIVRFPTLYGPGDRYNFLRLTRAIHRRRFVLFGGGHNRMALMGIDNAVAVLLCLGRSKAQGLYLADDGDEQTWRDITGHIGRALGQSGWIPSVPLVAGKLAARLGDGLGAWLAVEAPLTTSRLDTLTVDMGFCIDRLRSAGYRPVRSTKQAIDLTVAAYRRAGLL